MVGVFIFILISFLLFYILTQVAWVRIIKENELSIEIHLPIFALYLTDKNETGRKKRPTKKNKTKLSAATYIQIITDIIKRLKHSEIIVKYVRIPIKTDNFNQKSILRPLRQHALLCAFVAYVRTKAEKLVLEDNAFTLSPDINALRCYVTVKAPLYKIIQGVLYLLRRINEENKKAKEG